MIFKDLLVGVFLLMFLVQTVRAKEWRGIIPLKSTRADVERLLGKPNQLGRYEVGNERVTISYSEGPCEGDDGGLAEANCECLAAKDTVLKIAVTFDSPKEVSKLGIDKRKYERTPIHAYRPTATYADFAEGVVYTIRESDEKVTNIDYLPSAKDCEYVIKRQTSATSSIWRGIVPLFSTRADVERLLGFPETSLGEIAIYRTTAHRINVSYADDPCNRGGQRPKGTPKDVVVKVILSHHRRLFVNDIPLDKSKFIRVQDQHPANLIHYMNSEDGITIEAMLNDGCEEVVSIVYRPTTKDLEFRCRTGSKTRVP